MAIAANVSVVLGGDFIDCYEISSFEKEKSKRSFKSELQLTKQFFSFLRFKFPKARIYAKMGNHEERYERYIRKNASALDGIEDFELGNLLDFDKWKQTQVFQPTGEQANQSAQSIAFETVGSERMRITSGGQVLINSTSMDGKLGINTATSVSYNPNAYNGTYANIRLTNGSAGVSRYTGIAFGGGGATEAFIGSVQNASELAEIVFQTYNGSAYGERARITSAGNVGIGTTAPASILHISTTGANAYSSTITKGGNMKGIVNTLSNNGDDMVGMYFATGTNAEGAHWSGITGSRSQSATDLTQMLPSLLTHYAESGSHSGQHN